MKVLLVSPSFEEFQRLPQDPNTAYSLGLAYLASSVEKAGHRVEIMWMDTYAFSYAHNQIISKIEEYNPDVLGISMFTMNRVSSYRLIEHCEKKHPDMRIVVGGIHASIMYEQLMDRYKNIVITRGEGEDALCEILEAYEKEKDLSGIKGLVYVQDGKVMKTPDREINEKIDQLPHPKHEHFFDIEPGRTTAHMITSRGCPFNCAFCCLHIISKRRFRPRSVDDVIEEIKALKKKYPRLKTVQFHDDNFTLDNGRVIEFCKKVIDLDLGLNFIASGRIKPVSEEMLSYMEKAGFTKLMFGLETGSERMLRSINKEITPNDAINLFKKLRNCKMTITTFLMVGFPGENRETVKESIELVKKLQKIRYNYIIGVGKLIIYPGTQIYKVMKEKGEISDDYWMTDGDVPFYTAEMSLEEMKKLESEMLDHISLLRIFTPRGFVHHLLSMPQIILPFLMKNKYMIRSILGEALRNMSPGVHRYVYKKYKHDKA